MTLGRQQSHNHTQTKSWTDGEANNGPSFGSTCVPTKSTHSLNGNAVGRLAIRQLPPAPRPGVQTYLCRIALMEAKVCQTGCACATSTMPRPGRGVETKDHHGHHREHLWLMPEWPSTIAVCLVSTRTCARKNNDDGGDESVLAALMHRGACTGKDLSCMWSWLRFSCGSKSQSHPGGSLAPSRRGQRGRGRVFLHRT